jgi:hypothetical protein
MTGLMAVAVFLLGALVGDAAPDPGPELGARAAEAWHGEPGPIPWGGSDFIQYYVTARLVHLGHDPYDLEAAGLIQRQLGREGAPLETYGPPPCLLPYLPLAPLSFPQAVGVNLVLSTALLLACARAWTRWLVASREPGLILCCLAAVPLWPPVVFVLGMGQNTVLVLAAFTAAVACLRRGRDFMAGACLALTTVKPHLAVGLVAFAAAWALRGRRWWVLGGMAAGLAGCAGLITAVQPSIWSQYAAFLTGVTPPGQYHGATLDGWGRLHLGPWFRLVSWPLWALGVAAAGALGCVGGTDETLPRRAALAACLALAVVPHAFSYDFVLLLPVFLAAVGGAMRRQETGWSWRALVIAAAVGILLAGKSRGWQETAFCVVPWLGALVAASLVVRPVGALSPRPGW